MATETYCEDADLLTYRSNILSLGVADWEIQRAEAFSTINRMLIARWYNQAAKTQGVDPTLTFFEPAKIEEGFLKRLECFKTLEFAYMILMKDAPDEDGFERNMKLFARQYGAEFDSVIGMGVSYDWSGDGTLDSEETKIRAPRRLMRC